MTISSSARTGMWFAAASAILLIVMFAVGSSASASMDLLGQAADPDELARALKTGAPRVIALLAVDNLFLIAYTGTFIAGTNLFWKKAQLLGALSLFFAGLLALLDLSENALIIHMSRAAANGLGITPGQVAGLALVEQVKYGSASLALAFIAAGMLSAGPVRSALQKVMAGTFLLFGPVNALKVIYPKTSLLLVLWMLVMIVISSLFFRQVAGVYSGASEPDDNTSTRSPGR